MPVAWFVGTWEPPIPGSSNTDTNPRRPCAGGEAGEGDETVARCQRGQDHNKGSKS